MDHFTNKPVAIGMTLFVLAALPTNWAQGASATRCNGSNTTGMSCGPHSLEDSSALQNLSGAMNFLRDSKSCNGILTSPQEIQFARQVDAIDAKYIAGGTTSSLRAQELRKLIESYSKGKAPVARGFLTALAQAEGTKKLVQYARLVAMNAAFGNPLTKPQEDVLAKMGLPRDKIAASIRAIAKTEQPLASSMVKNGIRFSSKGWDFSQSHLTTQDLKNNSTLKKAISQFLPSPIAKSLLKEDRQQAVIFGNSVFLPPPLDHKTGLRNGAIRTMTPAQWKQSVQSKIENAKAALTEQESAWKASTTFWNLWKQRNGKETPEAREANRAYMNFTNAIHGFQDLGVPGGKGGLVYAFSKLALQQDEMDSAELDHTIAQINATLHGFEVLKTGSEIGLAVGATILTAGAAAGPLLAGSGVTVLGLSESTAGLAGALEGGSGAAAFVSGAWASAGEIAGVTVVGTSLALTTLAMPYAIAGMKAGVNATADTLSTSGVGGLFNTDYLCRLGTDYFSQAGQNAGMSAFAFAGPAAEIVGIGGEVLSDGVMSAETATGLANLGTSAGFSASLDLTISKEARQCVNSWKAARAYAASHGHEIKNSLWGHTMKTCGNGLADTGFMIWGAKNFRNEAAEHLSETEGPVGDWARRQMSNIQTKALIKQGIYTPGDVVTDKRSGKSYIISEMGKDDRGTFYIAKDQNGNRALFTAQDLKSGKTIKLVRKGQDRRAASKLAARASQGEIAQGDLIHTKQGTLRVTKIDPEKDLLTAVSVQKAGSGTADQYTYKLSDVKNLREKSALRTRTNEETDDDAIPPAKLKESRNYVRSKLFKYLLKIGERDPHFKVAQSELIIEHLVNEKLEPQEVVKFEDQLRNGKFTDEDLQEDFTKCGGDAAL